MEAERKFIQTMHIFIACFLIGTIVSGVQEEVFIIREKKDITLPCTVSNQDNNVKVTWYKYPDDLISVNKNVQRSYKTRMSVDNPYNGEWNLKITRLTHKDSGNYTCRVGEEVILNGKLLVESSPIIQETQNMTFDEGDTGTLWCNATGYPTPTVHWYWKPPNQTDGIGQDSRAEGNRLVLHNMSRYYDNIYVCLAKNSVDEKSRDIRIRVKFGPEVVVPQNTIIATKRQEVTLHCAVEAFPMEGKLEWAFRNDSLPISSGWKYDLRPDEDLVKDYNTLFLSMTIRKDSLEDSDYGKYVCRTSNFSSGYSENFVVIQKPIEDNEDKENITNV